MISRHCLFGLLLLLIAAPESWAQARSRSDISRRLSQQQRSARPAPVRMPEAEAPTEYYDVVFDNAEDLDISEIFLVAMMSGVPATAKQVPEDAYVARLPVPEPGRSTKHTICFQPNQNSRLPVCYLAVFSAQLKEPLWVRVPIKSASAATKPADSADAASSALTMANSVAAAGSKSAAEERYRAILRTYPGTSAAKAAQTKLGLTDAQVNAYQQWKPAATDSSSAAPPMGTELAKSARAIALADEAAQAAAAEEARLRAEAAAAAARAAAERDARIPEELRPVVDLIKQQFNAMNQFNRALKDSNEYADQFQQYTSLASKDQYQEPKLAHIAQARAAHEAGVDAHERMSTAHEQENAASEALSRFPRAVRQQARDAMLKAGDWGDIQQSVESYKP